MNSGDPFSASQLSSTLSIKKISLIIDMNKKIASMLSLPLLVMCFGSLPFSQLMAKEQVQGDTEREEMKEVWELRELIKPFARDLMRLRQLEKKLKEERSIAEQDPYSLLALLAKQGSSLARLGQLSRERPQTESAIRQLRLKMELSLEQQLGNANQRYSDCKETKFEDDCKAEGQAVSRLSRTMTLIKNDIATKHYLMWDKK